VSDFLPLLALLAAAVAIYVIRERQRRSREVRPASPALAIASVPAPEDVRADLAGIEQHALASDHPRQAIRVAILHNATLALHLEAIGALPEAERSLLLRGYEPGMDRLLQTALASHRAIWEALRTYARLKYDDAVPGDWFDHYLHQAGPYIREKVRLARDCLLQVDASAGRFAEIYDALLAELRDRSLAARPKRRFPPADL
jgi:hypothetical protein